MRMRSIWLISSTVKDGFPAVDLSHELIGNLLSINGFCEPGSVFKVRFDESGSSLVRRKSTLNLSLDLLRRKVERLEGKSCWRLVYERGFSWIAFEMNGVKMSLQV